MAKIQSGGPPPYQQLAEPPSAGSDSGEVYIEKLLAQGGMKPPSWSQDSFEKAGVSSARTDKSFTDKALKWAGIVFAGALALVGLQRFAGGSLKKAAETAVKKVTQ